MGLKVARDDIGGRVPVAHLSDAGDTEIIAIGAVASASLDVSDGLYLLQADVSFCAVQSGVATAQDESFLSLNKSARWLSGNISVISRGGVGVLQLTRLP